MEHSPLWKYFFSHHPLCARYQNHTIKIKGIQFCIGCTFGYPASVMAILTGHLLLKSNIVKTTILLVLGAMMYVGIALSFTKVIEIKIVKILQKIFAGFGGGLLAIAFFYQLHYSLWFKVLLTWIFLVILMIPVIILHLRSFSQGCKSCALQGKDPFCLPNFYKKI